MQEHSTIPLGFCHCGCGQKTKIAHKNYPLLGWIKGQPMRYLNGHNSAERARPLHERFWSKVEQTDTCWLWKASCNHKGYGWLRINGGATSLAHRVSWNLSHGLIPDGMGVLHHCDTPQCVRPDHLFLGTIADNVADSVRKGRRHSKLTENDIRAIRNLQSPSYSSNAIGRLYGVDGRTIRSIWAGRLWKHLL